MGNFYNTRKLNDLLLVYSESRLYFKTRKKKSIEQANAIFDRPWKFLFLFLHNAWRNTNRISTTHYIHVITIWVQIVFHLLLVVKNQLIKITHPFRLDKYTLACYITLITIVWTLTELRKTNQETLNYLFFHKPEIICEVLCFFLNNFVSNNYFVWRGKKCKKWCQSTSLPNAFHARIWTFVFLFLYKIALSQIDYYYFSLIKYYKCIYVIIVEMDH